MTTTIFKGDSPAIDSMQHLVEHFRSGEKPRERWGVGTEHEKLGFFGENHAPVPYEGERGIGAILEQFRSRFGWIPVWEGENPVALMRGEASITLEPGGQVELSGAVLPSTHETCAELKQHAREINAISADLGLDWLGIGRNPLVPSSQMPWMPKERYSLMRSYLPTRGSMALDMMLGTGTVQTNIDYGDEADMARKFRVAMGLTPVLTALYANSPFAEGRPTGYLSMRSRIWEDTDPDRSGFIPAVFAEGFGYEAYADYALDVPMFFIYRDGHYVDYGGRSFRRFMAEGLDGHHATAEDWELHLTTIFPHVRLKKYLELRMADVGPTAMICAFTALTRGLFYDAQALEGADALVQRLPVAELAAVQHDVARLGLRAQLAGRPVQAWAQEVLELAQAGLARLDVRDEQGEDEQKFLAPLQRIADSGRTLADELLARWEGPWGHSLEPLFTSELSVF